MELIIKGEPLNSLLDMARSNEKSARSLARQWIQELETNALTASLPHSADVAPEPLAARLTCDP